MTRHSGPVIGGTTGRAGSGSGPARSLRGATLIEALVGLVIFSLTMVGVYAGLVQSYKLEAICRYRDNSRAILRTYVDQFQRLQTTVEHNNQPWSRWLFVPTDATGQGLRSWEEGLSDYDKFDYPTLPAGPLTITLGTGDYALTGQLTREVNYIHPSTGAVSETRIIEATGYLLRGIFTITFTYSGKTYAESLSVLRTVK